MQASASKKTLFATEQDRPDVARKRERWKAYQSRLDPARLVFIDETWAKTNMTRLRGWAPRGHKLLAKVPQGHWRTLTFLAALRSDRIKAPCVIANDRGRPMLRKDNHPREPEILPPCRG